MGKLKNYYLYYIVTYIGIGAYFPFLNVYLEKNIGLSGLQIGQIGSFTLFVGMLASPLWGMICDKTKKYKTMLAIMTVMTTLAVYFLFNAYTYVYVLFLLSVQTFSRAALFPVMDSLTMAYCDQHGKDFAPIRGLGSAGYVAGSFAAGLAADWMGFDGAFLTVFMICFIASLGPLFMLDKPEMKSNTGVKSSMVKDFGELIKNKKYIFILCCTIPTICVMNSGCGFAGNHLVTTLGSNQSIISWFTMMCALPEVVFIAVFNKILDRFGYKKLFIVALLTQMLRFAVYAFIPSSLTFLAITTVHAISTAIGTVGVMNYIKKVVEPHIMTTAFTLYGSFVSLIQAIFNIVFGKMYMSINSYSIFIASLIITGIGLIFISRTKYLDIMENRYE